MTDNNNDVSMDPLYQDTFELSGVHAGWRNQYTDRQRYASMRKWIIRVISRFVQSYNIQVEEEEKDEVQEAEEDEDKL